MQGNHALRDQPYPISFPKLKRKFKPYAINFPKTVFSAILTTTTDAAPAHNKIVARNLAYSHSLQSSFSLVPVFNSAILHEELFFFGA
jgi:hypothetical protein